MAQTYYERWLASPEGQAARAATLADPTLAGYQRYMTNDNDFAPTYGYRKQDQNSLGTADFLSFDPDTYQQSNPYELGGGGQPWATPGITLQQASNAGLFGSTDAGLADYLSKLYKEYGKTDADLVSNAQAALQTHINTLGQGYTPASGWGGIVNGILKRGGVDAGVDFTQYPGFSDADAARRGNADARRNASGGTFGQGNIFSDVASYEETRLGDISHAYNENPERVVLGINTPAESKLWSTLTGKPYEETVDMYGADTKKNQASATSKGLDPSVGQLGHTAARATVGGVLGGGTIGESGIGYNAALSQSNAALSSGGSGNSNMTLGKMGVGALSTYLGNNSDGTVGGNVDSPTLSGSANNDTLSNGGNMDLDFDPSYYDANGDTNFFDTAGGDDTAYTNTDGSTFDQSDWSGTGSDEDPYEFTGVGEGALGGGGDGDSTGGAGGAVNGLVKKLLSGDLGALKSLLGLGVPAAAIAGLLEKNKSPLVAQNVNAQRAAVQSADQFAAAPALGLSPSQQQAIKLANSSVGSWQPYFDNAGALVTKGTSGVTPEQTNKYFNPELQGVLDPTIRDITEAAEKRRQQLRAEVARSGNDYYDPGTTPTRFNISDSLIDREMLRSVGDATGKIRTQAWNDATGLASKDLDRALTGANVEGGLGKTAGALGSVDIGNLTTAGALEQAPALDARQHSADAAKLYSSVGSGMTGSIPASTPQSTLSKGVGALGALKTAKDIGLY